MNTDGGNMPEKEVLLFSLNEPTKKAVADIVGAEHVACIEDAALIYHDFKKRFYARRPPIPQLNIKLDQARKHIAALTELLGEATTRDYLLGIAKEHFSEAGGKQLIAKTTPFVNKTPRLLVSDSLDKLDKVCEAAMDKQKPGPGRPKGQKTEAIHALLNNLCQCCESANGGPITTKPGNMLDQLVKVLNKPLGLGGELPGLVRKTIEKNTKKEQKPNKEK